MKRAFCSAILLLLVACGGGGDDIVDPCPQNVGPVNPANPVQPFDCTKP